MFLIVLKKCFVFEMKRFFKGRQGEVIKYME